jgi:lauroyl/myristoyl acyltransferase|tara:strand:- start:8193 stop:8486 length:294 start_codon:yes stop_codon:yes gene_type:complete
MTLSKSEAFTRIQEIGDSLATAGALEFATNVQPRLRDMVLRGTAVQVAKVQGHDMSLAEKSLEAELSNLGVEERNWIVKTQFDTVLRVLLEVLDAAT